MAALAGDDEFVVTPDEDAVRLREWQQSDPQELAPRAQTPGLVLVAQWGWATEEGSACREWFESLTSTTSAVDPSLYVYPAHSTHITVSTLSSFKKLDGPRVGLSPSDDERLLKAWTAALARLLARDPIKPFEVEVARVDISPGAAFIFFEDHSGSILQLRELVKEARDTDPDLLQLDTELGGRVKAAVHVPNIIHSSFARFVALPADVPRLREAFAREVGGSIGPLTIRVDEITLANECAP